MRGVLGLVSFLLVGCYQSPSPRQPPPPVYDNGSSSFQHTAEIEGVWDSNFGQVKFQRTEKPGFYRGVWMFEREGEQVIGYFEGELTGKQFWFRWHQPGEDGQDRVGSGRIFFNEVGNRFDGTWATEDGGQNGNWNGSRVPSVDNDAE